MHVMLYMDRLQRDAGIAFFATLFLRPHYKEVIHIYKSLICLLYVQKKAII